MGVPEEYTLENITDIFDNSAPTDRAPKRQYGRSRNRLVSSKAFKVQVLVLKSGEKGDIRPKTLPGVQKAVTENPKTPPTAAILQPESSFLKEGLLQPYEFPPLGTEDHERPASGVSLQVEIVSPEKEAKKPTGSLNAKKGNRKTPKLQRVSPIKPVLKKQLDLLKPSRKPEIVKTPKSVPKTAPRPASVISGKTKRAKQLPKTIRFTYNELVRISTDVTELPRIRAAKLGRKPPSLERISKVKSHFLIMMVQTTPKMTQTSLTE